MILVYSVTSRSSFDAINYLHHRILHVRSESPALERIPLFLIGNKADEVAQREVASVYGTAVADKLNCAFAEVSAKDGKNAEDVVVDIVRSVRKMRPVEVDASGSWLRFLKRLLRWRRSSEELLRLPYLQEVTRISVSEESEASEVNFLKDWDIKR